MVFRNALFAPSEGFIHAQAEAMRLFTPHYVGSVCRSHGVIDRDRVHLLHGSGWTALNRLAFYLFGIGPRRFDGIRHLNACLIHAHFGPDGVTALPLARRLGIPLVVTFHGYDACTIDEVARRSFLRHRLYARRRKQLGEEASLLIAVSRFIRDQLIERGFAPQKILRHYIGIDTKVFAPIAGISRGPTVLFVGRLVREKGCEYLIDAMTRVRQAVPGARLEVVGDGPFRHELERLAGSLRLDARFLGFRTRDEVRAAMAKASVFCLPSFASAHGSAEGLGLVLLEAQAMELPVVASRVGGTPEAVVEGETGFLIDQCDSVGLATRIAMILSNPGLGRRLGEAGRRRVKQDFDLTSQTATLEALFKEGFGASGKSELRSWQTEGTGGQVP
jgi:glycosyltransferase involved in cell wall biosynthesis